MEDGLLKVGLISNKVGTTWFFTIGYLWVGFFFVKIQLYKVQQNPVLNGFVRSFLHKKNTQCINMRKVGVFPPLLIIADYNTHGNN